MFLHHVVTCPATTVQICRDTVAAAWVGLLDAELGGADCKCGWLARHKVRGPEASVCLGAAGFLHGGVFLGWPGSQLVKPTPLERRFDMAVVSESEVLLCWRALWHFRSGRRPTCAPRGSPATSLCPLFDACPRWRGQPDDYHASLDEDQDATERRRASWPCTRLLDLLSPEAHHITG